MVLTEKQQDKGLRKQPGKTNRELREVWLNWEWRLEWRKMLKRNRWEIDWNGIVLWKECKMKTGKGSGRSTYINGRGKGGEEDRNCDRGCIKRDLERLGEEWSKKRRKWRLLIEKVKTYKWGRKKTLETEIIVNSFLTTGMPGKQ